MKVSQTTCDANSSGISEIPYFQTYGPYFRIYGPYFRTYSPYLDDKEEDDNEEAEKEEARLKAEAEEEPENDALIGKTNITPVFYFW